LIDTLAVTIEVTQDMVWQSASGQTKGFAFQLNAYSPQGELSAWQQYIIILWDTTLTGMIDNWPVNGNNIINHIFSLAPLPNTIIPAGYRLSIGLLTDPNGNIRFFQCIIIYNNSNEVANVMTDLLSIPGVTEADLAPIVAFELDIVGPINAESAVLSSGAGTITYESSNQLTVLTLEPGCTESSVVTAETANTFYGTLPAVQSSVFTQTFNVTEMQMIRKRGKARPFTRLPPHPPHR
jgi:hypothetical protein